MKDWQEKKGKRWVGSYENETFDVIVLAKNAQGFFYKCAYGVLIYEKGYVYFTKNSSRSYY